MFVCFIIQDIVNLLRNIFLILTRLQIYYDNKQCQVRKLNIKRNNEYL